MTTSHKVAAGVFNPARVNRAVACTALTAVLAVVFALSVMVEVSNALDTAPLAGATQAMVMATAPGAASAAASVTADALSARGITVF